MQRSQHQKKSGIWRFKIIGSTIVIILSIMAYAGLYSAVAQKAMLTPYLSGLSAPKPKVVSIIEKKTFGYSLQGKPIEGYVVGKGENTILLFASIHGDEISTTDLLNVFIDELRNNPSVVSEKNRLVIIPILNPDGYYDRYDKLNANNVNLNLNFATTDWKKYGPEGTYAGLEPFSEIESRVLRQVIEDYQPNAMIAYHASGALVTPEIDETSKALGKWYTKETGYSYYDHENFNWDYPGTATKWFVQTYKKPAVTVELTKYKESDWEINKKALLKLASSEKPWGLGVSPKQ